MSEHMKRFRFPSVTQLAWRFATGMPLDGKPRMNYSWRRKGTMPKHKANWWNCKSRFGRMRWRWGTIATIILVIVGLVAETAWCLYALAAMTPYAVHRTINLVRVEFPLRRKVAVADPRSDPRVEREILDHVGAVTFGPDVEAISAPTIITERVKGGKIVRDSRFPRKVEDEKAG
jgi:hypothetical protein